MRGPGRRRRLPGKIGNMQEQDPSILKAALLRPRRPPQDNVPQTRGERDALQGIIQRYVRDAGLVGPLSMDELLAHSHKVISLSRTDARCRPYAAVLLNNEVWRETLAGIPYDRRLLLLPQCLRCREKCQATIDELGLVCAQCGSCSIADLQAEAQRIGYVVMVAEGSPVVMSLIETGKVEAVVGVSCLGVLERVFPYMEAGAIPGIAIPLLCDGCGDTRVDLDWVYEAIYLSRSDGTRRLDLDGLRREVDSWFAPESLGGVLGPACSRTEEIARAWLSKSGKRWRPFLAACVFKALQADADAPPGDDLRKIALAVECFHKASLIHDDIEDQDIGRYGDKSLHEEYGVPLALNVGDLLLGLGYQMIARADVRPDRKADMLRVAAEGHMNLCIGQGEELCWMRDPRALSPLEVLNIFRQKTSPAFEVALRLGAICAGADQEVWSVLTRYSEALGIAYQIRDDLEDFLSPSGGGDAQASRPSILLALACQRASGQERNLLEALWRTCARGETLIGKIADIFARLQIESLTARLLESYKTQAIRCLGSLSNASLKGLLRRVVSKIFDDVKVMPCCDEYKASNAPGRPVGQEPAG